MKARLIIILCLLGITQSFAQSKLTPGIRAGWTMSTVANMGGDYRTNFYIGLQLPVNFTNFYTLQPEVNYSRQGVNDIQIYDFNSESIRTTNLTLDYIDINAISKFKLNKITLQAGPGIAFLANSSIPDLAEADIIFNLGIGIQITNRLGVEARWKPGIIDINEDFLLWDRNSEISYLNDGYLRNNVFQIGAYFTF